MPPSQSSNATVRGWRFPCDPQAETFRVPVEASRPEYPGVHDKYLRIPMEAGYRELCEKALETEGTVTYGPACDYPSGKQTDRGIRSAITDGNVHQTEGRQAVDVRNAPMLGGTNMDRG